MGDVDAVDHHQTQPVEEGGDGQQEGIGIRRGEAQHDVEGERDREQPAGLGREIRWDGVVGGDLDGDIGEHDDADGEDQQEEFDIAAPAWAQRGDHAHGVLRADELRVPVADVAVVVAEREAGEVLALDGDVEAPVDVALVDVDAVGVATSKPQV